MNDYRTGRPLQGTGSSWYGPYGARPGIERPDEDIRSEVIESLENDHSADFSGVIVRVENGIVMLSGQVETEGDRSAAEDDAWDVPGIVDVHNHLLVNMP